MLTFLFCHSFSSLNWKWEETPPKIKINSINLFIDYNGRKVYYGYIIITKTEYRFFFQSTVLYFIEKAVIFVMNTPSYKPRIEEMSTVSRREI